MKNRNMFYSNVQEGMYNTPPMYTPGGYNINTQYQAYGPNVNGYNTAYQNEYTDDYEERISRLEKNVKKLDARLKKLESTSTDEIDSNLYML